MSTENFADEVETVEKAPETDSAQETASKPKKVIGRPITKETAKQYQLSASRAKRLRRLARAHMLDSMVNELDLGKELVDAVKSHDESRIRLIEKAVQIVGLHHDQSCEAMAQRLEIKSDNTNKTTGTVEVVVKGLDVK